MVSNAAHKLDIVVSAQKKGFPVGIPSICSANAFVLEAALTHALETEQPVLIESTCNQVNQFGGYTNMTPEGFRDYVFQLASKCGFPEDQIVLGGDHLGPNPWQDEPVESAMAKACDMVSSYVQAGYTKIHLDASMRCLDDDPSKPLDKLISAARAAEMASIAEKEYEMSGGNQSPPRYVIGTEVPVPGGIQQSEEQEIDVTSPADVEETITITQEAFVERGLEEAWERVVAVVVQPGVEFGDETLFVYDPTRARGLSRYIEQYDRLVYEAHSTDYQPRNALQNLVRDHFAILKVGPGLTFAFREAVFALAMIENEMFSREMDDARSMICERLESIMLESPNYWKRYYEGSPADRYFARKYSFSDRSRYYWPIPEIQTALQRLIHNLETHEIPLSLLSQYLPMQYENVRNKSMENTPLAIIRDKITTVLKDYTSVCGI